MTTKCEPGQHNNSHVGQVDVGREHTPQAHNAHPLIVWRRAAIRLDNTDSCVVPRLTPTTVQHAASCVIATLPNRALARVMGPLRITEGSEVCAAVLSHVIASASSAGVKVVAVTL